MPWVFLNRYTLAAAFVAALVLWGTVEHLRANHWETRYENFRAATAALGLAAEAKAKAAAAAQEKATQEIRAQSERERSRVAAYYRGLLDNAGRGSVPTVAECPAVAHGPAPEPEPRRESVTVESCALDAQQVMAFQDWVRREGIPIK